MLLAAMGGAIGAISGAWRARRLGGSAGDMAQYGAGFAICFALLGMVAALILARAFG